MEMDNKIPPTPKINRIIVFMFPEIPIIGKAVVIMPMNKSNFILPFMSTIVTKSWPKR